ncbi:kazal-type serine protease inhibitor domain-containing protein [Cryptosporidium muris RN66]|uniref:Kazal-type serine protease inhibitor domain-containing protein n=1 Tax=Cryptosporidium muris (strain RN66) TaxID=441375 RepID=B6AEJ8_CRYMR|nr:kazal-type serine protease inhibitor domain-containing protein [Cryptosporidium muris RN66]EEA06615.1 kazal-type serine protease inhibitor domain-containing protein [Cryptosporidium muris RN66]|eukprot:XP_002140964.1 kazal-type serine protease inhibitor domain-containing protein [Cryptosporidium muris RN66]
MELIDYSNHVQQDECAIQCTLDFFPHCASNGVTYINECFYERARCRDPKIQLLKIPGIPCGLWSNIDATRYTGCERPCEPIAFPFCGTDGITYLNECALNVASCENPNIQLARLPGIPCGSDLYLIENSTECNQRCSEHYRPYCANNGITYNNYCEFRKAQCNNLTLSIVGFPGIPCDSQLFDENIIKEQLSKLKCSISKKCSNYVFPVCGSDGITYRNSCYFKKARCKNPLLHRANLIGLPCGSYVGDSISDIINNIPNRPNNSNITEVNRCWFNCTKVWKYPLCGSDGITYSSYCEMRNALCIEPDLRLVKIPGVKCESVFQFIRPIEIDKCQNSCTYGNELLYMCGSNHKTYYSFCELSIAMCHEPEIFLLKPMGEPCSIEDRRPDLEAKEKLYNTVYDDYYSSLHFNNTSEDLLNYNYLSEDNIDQPYKVVDRHIESDMKSDILDMDQDFNDYNENDLINSRIQEIYDNNNNNILSRNNSGIYQIESKSNSTNFGMKLLGDCDFDCSESPLIPHCGNNKLTYISDCAFHRDKCRDSKLKLISEPGIPCSSIPDYQISIYRLKKCARDCSNAPITYHCLNTGQTVNSYCEFLYMQCLYPKIKIGGPVGIPCDGIYVSSNINTQRNIW